MKLLFYLFFIIYCITGCKEPQNEEAAIKQLLEKESASWRSGDSKAHADCWAIKPYSRILISTPDGNVTDLDPAIMLNPPAAITGRGGYAVNSNYKFYINGNSATVSHNEVSTAADSTKTYSSEFRMLEKINGNWKLTGQSIHVYKPK